MPSPIVCIHTRDRGEVGLDRGKEGEESDRERKSRGERVRGSACS